MSPTDASTNTTKPMAKPFRPAFVQQIRFIDFIVQKAANWQVAITVAQLLPDRNANVTRLVKFEPGSVTDLRRSPRRQS
jgi:hypothetical protein